METEKNGARARSALAVLDKKIQRRQDEIKQRRQDEMKQHLTEIQALENKRQQWLPKIESQALLPYEGPAGKRKRAPLYHVWQRLAPVFERLDKFLGNVRVNSLQQADQVAQLVPWATNFSYRPQELTPTGKTCLIQKAMD